MPENKQDICNQLCESLRRTREWDDITGLKYIEESSDVQYVYIDFKDHPAARRINVSIDSGWAMIKDIIRALNHDSL